LNGKIKPKIVKQSNKCNHAAMHSGNTLPQITD